VQRAVATDPRRPRIARDRLADGCGPPFDELGEPCLRTESSQLGT